MRHPNPFRPTFGRPPHTLAGRDDAMRRFKAAMEIGPNHPDHSMLIRGPRGSGKTVLLAALRDTAESKDMKTVRITAKPEPTFADALIEQMTAASAQPRHRISSAHVSILGTGAGVSMRRATQAGEPSVHTRMLTAMEGLAEHPRGALVTIDEFHNSHIAAAREFAHALQDVAKIDGKPVMFVAAGLPSMEETVLADPGMTFFQRIARTQMKPLTSAEAAEALQKPIRAANHAISDEALDAAVAAASGYPFMVQLVGYHSWEHCTDASRLISLLDVHAGIRAAAEDMQNQVFAPVFRDLSETDRIVLDAMSDFNADEVRLSDLAHATGKTSNYLCVYVNRLCEADVIHRPSRGRLRFVHATMRDWLRQRRASHGAPSQNPSPQRTTPTVTVKERIINAHHETPGATHTAIAERLGTSPGYVGRIRRGVVSHEQRQHRGIAAAP